MSILTKIKEILSIPLNRKSNNCYFCKRNTSDMRIYKDIKDKKIKVCYLCVKYAERRAFRK